MDIIAVIAERKIQEGIERGAFDSLPRKGRIDCSLRGERFLIQWFRERFSDEPSPENVR